MIPLNTTLYVVNFKIVDVPTMIEVSVTVTIIDTYQ